jgi:hypothetical protein
MWKITHDGGTGGALGNPIYVCDTSLTEYTISGLNATTAYRVAVTAFTGCPSGGKLPTSGGSAAQGFCATVPFSSSTDPCSTLQEGAASEIASLQSAGLPAAASGLTVKDRTKTSLNFCWTNTADPDPPVSHHNVYASDGMGGEEKIVEQISPSKSCYHFSNLLTGSTYRFNVGTVTTRGETKASAVTHTAAGPPQPPSKPTLLTSSWEQPSITITWESPTDTGGVSLSQYTIYRDDCQGGSFSGPLFTITIDHS